MQNRKIIILVVLGIAALFSLLYGIVTPSKVRRGGASGPASVIVPQTKTKALNQAKGIIPSQRQAKKTSYDSWGRNPFTLGASGGTYDHLVLNGILWDQEKPMAIINENIVGIGDNVGAARVVDIKEDRVILNDGVSDFEVQ